MSNEMNGLDMSNGMSELEAKPKSKSKEKIMSKNMSEAEANDISNELEAIEAEISELQEDFGEFDLGLDDDDDAEAHSTTELDDLNTAIEGTVFEVSAAESSGGLTILQIADGLFPDQSMQEGFFSSINPYKLAQRVIKGKAGKIIKKIVRLVKKYRKLASCVPTVTIAVAAFKAGKYGTAFKSGHSAYKCIRARL